MQAAEYLVWTCAGGKSWKVVLYKWPRKTTAQIYLDKGWNRLPLSVDMGRATLSKKTVVEAVRKALNYKPEAPVNLLVWQVW